MIIRNPDPTFEDITDPDRKIALEPIGSRIPIGNTDKYTFLSPIIFVLQDGKYLIVKDPNKPLLRLYDIPDNTFDTEESSDESEEGMPVLTTMSIFSSFYLCTEQYGF